MNRRRAGANAAARAIPRSLQHALRVDACAPEGSRLGRAHEEKKPIAAGPAEQSSASAASRRSWTAEARIERMSGAAGAVLALAAALALLCAGQGARAHPLARRSAEISANEFADYDAQRVMPKRAALFLDRLIVALQKVVENDELRREGTKSYVRSLPEYSDAPEQRMQLSDEKTMDLQRRGQGKNRVYWRCYFNAVTCFRRK